MRHGRAIALTLGALISVGTATADAATRYQFKFTGRGFGHGVGMSQYGAQGAALAGMKAEKIIGMYFPGTALQKLPTTTVRVLLGTSIASRSLTASGQWTLTNRLGQTRTMPTGAITVTVIDGTTMVFKDSTGKIVFRAGGLVTAQPVGSSILAIGAKRYRGALRLTPANNRFSVINVVDLEKYLPGVVPLEMPASWAPQALRAQVIAARSYAMATKRTGEFDMYADERSQMYGGVNAEDSRTNAAVATSVGLVATYGGRVATTFFSSTSGGVTESAQSVFGNAVPYLVSISDEKYDAISPRHIWGKYDQKVLKDWQISRALGLPRPVLAMRVVSRSPAGRALKVRVVQTDGKVSYFTGSTFRWKFGLSSTWFYQSRSIVS
jgi:stage II sporulation protein D